MDGTAQPTGSNKPELDMDAINAAVNATAGNDPNLQGTFDVNDISLDDTPTTAAELEQQMQKNPEMSLAGTVIDKTVSTEDAVKAPQVKLSADVATTTPQDPSIIADNQKATLLPIPQPKQPLTRRLRPPMRLLMRQKPTSLRQKSQKRTPRSQKMKLHSLVAILKMKNPLMKPQPKNQKKTLRP